MDRDIMVTLVQDATRMGYIYYLGDNDAQAVESNIGASLASGEIYSWHYECSDTARCSGAGIFRGKPFVAWLDYDSNMMGIISPRDDAVDIVALELRILRGRCGSLVNVGNA
jgi:hypothetical protein